LVVIVSDSREQLPWPFKKNKFVEDIKKGCLKTGDYSIEGFENKIAIERKSLADLFQTTGQGHKRFKKELERAKDLDYFAIIVEGSFTNIINEDYEGAQYTKMRGYIVMKILMSWIMKYDIDVFFCKDRKECVNLTNYLFLSYLKNKGVKL